MKYLCLIYGVESKWESMAKSDMDTMMAEYGAFTQSIKASGHFEGGHEL